MGASAPIELAEVEAAAERLRGVVVRTGLVPLHGHPDILLSQEIHQVVGCFKIRGVFHAVARLTDEERARGLSTVSAGNTAKALAWSARHFGVEARSLMPEHAPRTKIDAIRAHGATPILVPVEEVFAYLREHRWESEPYAFVHPWTDRDLRIGHGTLGLEILEACPEVDTVFVPVGGGGLCAGVARALRLAKPSVRVVAVEPAGCPALHAALAHGAPVDVECDTMCDGVAVPYITDEMFPLLAELIDDCVLVEEESVRATIRALVTGNHIVAEGAGALATAAALSTPETERGVSVAIVTGGSIDAAELARILVETD